MIITSTRQEYLYALKDFSGNRHTSSYLVNQIEEIITRIGTNKISAIVSDNAANIALAREEISRNYPKIINLRCIAHCFNLISQDIVNIPFAKKLLQRCNIIVNYFKTSHLAASLLQDAIKEKKIIGGTLKTYVKTRWITTYNCIDSVLRCKIALQYVSIFNILIIYINIL
jgi:hypothetical protein